jgi:hypothetical protein
MIDPELLKLEQEMGREILSAFIFLEPDQSFADRLQKELERKINSYNKTNQGQKPPSRNSHWFGKLNPIISPFAWVAIAIIVIYSLIWGITSLIPGTVPGRNTSPSPTPVVSPSPIPTEPSTLASENAIFYTVMLGDTLSIIESKTNVPMETLINLNAFVLQANTLNPGVQLLIGFEDQRPIFYTVRQGDTILGISKIAGISIEDFVTLNRIDSYSSDTQTPPAVLQYILTPGMQVIIGLENNIEKYENARDELQILSEEDLNCDGYTERILGVKAPEIDYFNITPQLSMISIEKTNGSGFESVWEQTAQQAGVTYLAYKLFTADDCNQFIVVIGHKGKESVNVYRWDGERLTNVLKLSGRFLFEGDWMKDVFGDYKTSVNSLFIGELQQPTNDSKNIWILREYQWSDGALRLTTEKRVELSGGG